MERPLKKDESAQAELQVSTVAELEKAISKIKRDDTIKYGEEKIIALSIPANDFINRLRNHDFLPSTPIFVETICEELKELIQKRKAEIEKTLFFIWLNKQPGFKSAKDRLVNAGLLTANRTVLNPLNLFSYTQQYGLEFFLANAIYQYSTSVEHLSNVVFIPKDWKKLPEELTEKITLMASNFELQSERHLFLYLFNRLKNSKGNIFNSGRPHKHQVREFFTKIILNGLFFNFFNCEISNTLVADVALDIVGDFFDSMNRHDAIHLADQMREEFKQEMVFLHKMVAEIIFQHPN